MRLECYCFHKSGSMFLYRLFKKISETNDINYYSINNTPPNAKCFQLEKNGILCPLRSYPINYNPNTKYIIHIRNPFDVLISQYYSFGFSHKVPDKDDVEYQQFMDRREKIQSQTIEEYCSSDENINEINNKYNKLLEWVDKYKIKENVFISYYDNMYYSFPEWLKNIYNFIGSNELDNYHEILSIFKDEFSLSNRYRKMNININNISHRRSGLSKQYYDELDRKTVDLVINKFTVNIRNNFDFTEQIVLLNKLSNIIFIIKNLVRKTILYVIGLYYKRNVLKKYFIQAG